jgi:hypothetical protein
VAELGTSESVNFTIPSRGIYLLNSIANGIASATILNVEMTSATDALLIRNDPSNSANVQVISGTTIVAETAISGIAMIIVTCDDNADTLNVNYQFGNPLPVHGLDYEDGSGVDTLNVNDQTTTTDQTFSLGTNVVDRSGSAPITFLSGGINFVNVNGGSGNNLYNVVSTEPGWATAIDTGSGTDVIDIAATGSRSTLAVNTSTGSLSTTNTVNLFMAGIISPVTFNNYPRHDALTLNDSSDSGNRTVNVTNLSITGLSGGAINWISGSISSITVLGGAGNNSYTVNAPQTSLGMTLDTGSGADTVNILANSAPLTVDTLSGSPASRSTVTVGNAGSLAGIGAPLTIHNNPDFDTVILDDSADSSNRTATVSSGGVTGLTPKPINFTSFSVTSLTIDGGMGTNRYTVTDTPVAGSMTLNTGTGMDTVAVQGTSAPLTVDTPSGGSSSSSVVTVGSSGSVQGILAALTIYNEPAFDTVILDDSADGANRTFTIGGGVTGLAPNPINFTGYSVSSLTINGGTGNSTYTITDTPVASFGSMTLNTGLGSNTVNVPAASGSLTMNGAGGRQTVNIGSQAPNLNGILASITAPVTVTNSSGALNVDDSGDNTGRTGTVNSTQITGMGLGSGGSINYNIGSSLLLSSLTVHGGSGSNTYNVAATPTSAGGTTALETGNDTSTCKPPRSP